MLTVGREIRDRFSGAVEAFARRNATGATPHQSQTKHRTVDDVPSPMKPSVVKKEYIIIHMKAHFEGIKLNSCFCDSEYGI